MWTLYLGLTVLVILTISTLWKVSYDYKSDERLLLWTAIYVWVSYILYSLLVAYTAFRSYWLLLSDGIWLTLIGILLIVVGSLISIAGVIEFRSFKRMSGLSVDILMTSGIYRWSRNPQNIGWGLVLVGIALTGRSGVALMLAFLFWLVIHFYIVNVEEKLLIKIFGDSYESYCATTPRYFGSRKK